MRHLLSALCLCLMPMQVFALCEGPDYMETLTPQDRAQIDAAVAQTPFPQGLLWQATKGEKTVSVIGTMHIFDPRLGAIVARTAPIVESADILLVEAGPDEEARIEAEIQQNFELIFITDGPTLPELLPEAEWQALAAAANARQVPAFMAAKMQPWYLSLMLSIPACTMADLAAGASGLDHLLMDVAKIADVPVRAVEPWDTLFAIMSSGSQAEQLEMLQMGLLPTDTQTAMFVAMLNSYFAGNIAEIWETSRVSMKDVPGLAPDRAAAMFAEAETLMLVDRNRAWMPKIAAATAAHDDVVLAVGAAHLPGQDGVLQLLQDDGWAISPLQDN